MLVTLACSNQGRAGSCCMYGVSLFGFCLCCCPPACLPCSCRCFGACVLPFEEADKRRAGCTSRRLPTLRACSGTLARTDAHLAAAAAGHVVLPAHGVDLECACYLWRPPPLPPTAS